jgi:hypothetical protein
MNGPKDTTVLSALLKSVVSMTWVGVSFYGVKNCLFNFCPQVARFKGFFFQMEECGANKNWAHF